MIKGVGKGKRVKQGLSTGPYYISCGNGPVAERGVQGDSTGALKYPRRAPLPLAHRGLT